MMPKLKVLQFKALVSEKPESGLECPFDIMLEIPREMEVLLDEYPTSICNVHAHGDCICFKI